MTAAVPISTAPSPTKVDELAREYNALKDKYLEATLAAKAAAQLLEDKEKELIPLVRDHGTPHAEKSWLLHGVKFEMMGTFGQTVQTDKAAVEKFRDACLKELKVRNVAKIFEVVTTYRLLSTAGEFVRTSELSRKLKALYAACQVIKDKSPTLVVREKNA